MTIAHPNIIFIIGEDTGKHLGCYGAIDALTPNLDAFARSGMLCSSVFTHSPVCAPSRSGLVTGRYPYSFGTHHMRSTLIKPPPLFTSALKSAGWHVSWPGKTDFNFELNYSEITDTRDWLKEGFPEEPFFVYTNLGQTHESSMWPEKETSKQDRQNRLRPQDRRNPATVQVPPWLPDTEEVRADISRHHENATCLDLQFGEILNQIDVAGISERTIVIFLVDHGCGIPRCKRWCYDGGVHMPLIVRWPGVISPGTIFTDLVGYVDIAPTLLSWCDLAIPTGMQGRVFWGKHAEGIRNFAFGGRDRMDEQFDRIRFARSLRFKYIRNFHPELPWAQRNHYMEKMPSMQKWRELHAAKKLDKMTSAWFALNKPTEELYDCVTDPHEMHNLAEDPNYARILDEHRVALTAHLKKVGDLGETSEWELIRSGLVVDRLTKEFSPMVLPLSEGLDNLGGPWDVEGKRWKSKYQ